MKRILIITAFLASVASAAPPAQIPRALFSPGPSGESPVLLRLLLPHASDSPSQDGELTELVEKFNRQNAAAIQVSLVRRGENFSSLKELVAAYLAGDTPELAVIESSEFSALDKMKLAHPIHLNGAESRLVIPFRTTVPILLADQEILYRLHVNPEQLPKNWPELARLVENIARTFNAENGAIDRHALALPLQGARGLWLFEALSAKPLWKREPGGIRTNRELQSSIDLLRKMADRPFQLAGDETWDRALQAFLERKSPLLIASLDSLPLIAKQATFRWTAGPVPTLQKGLAEMEGGSQLILTRDSPQAQKFIQFLMAPENAVHWLAPGGFLPPQSQWFHQHPAWENLGTNKAGGLKTSSYLSAYGVLARKMRATSHRSTDPEVVRIHSEWIQSLRLIFATESSQRLPLETIFTQLDTQLTGKSGF